MKPAPPAAQTPSPVASETLSASSRPSVIASPSRSLTGATAIGSPAGEPMVFFGCSTSALPEPSGFSPIKSTEPISFGAARTPGSGSSGMAKAAISAGEKCLRLLRLEKPSVAGSGPA